MNTIYVINKKILGHKINEFNEKAKISISFDDHIKRVSEEAQIKADEKYFMETPEVEKKEAPEVFQDTKEKFYDETKNDYDDKYNSVDSPKEVENNDQIVVNLPTPTTGTRIFKKKLIHTFNSTE